MLLLGIIIGLIIGAGVMHLRNGKKVSDLVNTLQDVQVKLKTTRSQLYRRRATYKKKSNSKSNGKKASTKKAKTKATHNVKKGNV